MIKYNIEFLTGKRINTFYYASTNGKGGLAKDTIPLLGKLVKINSHGYFTVNGQASDCTHPEIKQKSQLVGYLEQNNKTENLIEYLKSNDKLYFAVTRLDKNNKTVSYSTFPNSDYDVTIQYDNNKWDVFNNIVPITDYEDLYTFLGPTASYIKILKKCLYLEIAVKEYCKDSVEDELMKFYNSI